MIWAQLFVLLLEIMTVGGTNQYHLAYTMLLPYVHYITIGHLRQGVGGLSAKAKIILVIPNNVDLS